MYKFKPVSSRINEYHERIRNRVIAMDSERVMLLTEAYKQTEHLVPALRQAFATKYICENISCPVEDFEIIVGSLGKNFCGACADPRWKGIGWMPMEIRNGNFDLKEDGYYHNRNVSEVNMVMAKEDYENLISVEDYWKENRFAAMTMAWRPDGFEEFAKLNASSCPPKDKLMDAAAGHIIPGHHKILATGYGAIRKQATDWLEAHKGRAFGDDMNKYIFYQSVVWVCDGAIALIRGYAKTCYAKAEEAASPERKAELTKMGDSLMWISENPVRNYFEACQAIVMHQILLNYEAAHPGLAIGRFDYYTWPYLKKDIEAGLLTMDEAQEITDEFFLKLNCFYKGGHTGVAQIVGIGNTWQHTTIGGVDVKTGEDSTNPITYMVLETLGRLKLHDPTVSLRINKNTPNELWECAIETSKLVGGLPLYQNDEIIIPAAMKNLGYSLEDARNIGFIGCQEIVGSGTDYPCCTGAMTNHEKVHWGVALSMALNNGINPMNGEDSGIKTGYLYEMKSMDDVKAALVKIGKWMVDWMVTINNYVHYVYKRYSPHPALSMGIEGCMENGRDCTDGGAKYNSFGSCACGLATIADSLTSIEYMCFDKKLCTTQELYDAIMANWEGYEELRNQVLQKVPHFGNNDPYADKNMSWIVNTYCDLCDDGSIERTDIYRKGMFSAADHVMQGYHTWATPDGRKTGDSIADAASPAQGRDKSGPTAVFASSCCYDNSRYMNGIALNMRFTPTALKSDDDMAKFRDLTKAFFKAGGMEVQYNIVSTETLRAAQAKPEEYRDLVVRIAGYSAYFVQLTGDCQNDVIKRNENVL